MIETTWHIAVAEPRQDATAKFHLEREGFIGFSPWCHVAVRRKRNRAERLGEKKIITPMRRPVFPRYVFFGAVPGQFWNAAKRCRGVREVLMATGGPVLVRPQFIAELMSRCDAVGHMHGADDPAVQEKIDSAAKFSVGDKIRLVNDAYGSLVAMVSAIDGRGNLEVEMTIFGSTRAVKVDPSSASLAAE